MTPRTLAAVAAGLRAAADRLDTLDGDKLGPLFATLDIQVYHGDTATVDAVNVALTGAAARTRQLSGGTWHHGTEYADRHAIAGINVNVFTAVEDPEVAKARAERDRLLAEVAELRAAARDAERPTGDPVTGLDSITGLVSGGFVAACSYCGSLDHEEHTHQPGEPVVHPVNEIPRRHGSAWLTPPEVPLDGTAKSVLDPTAIRRSVDGAR